MFKNISRNQLLFVYGFPYLLPKLQLYFQVTFEMKQIFYLTETESPFLNILFYKIDLEFLEKYVPKVTNKQVTTTRISQKKILNQGTRHKMT